MKLKQHIKSSTVKTCFYLNRILHGFSAENNFYIFSDPRGGSTWLMQMLAQVPHTLAIWEPFHPVNGLTDKDLAINSIKHVIPTKEYPGLKKEFNDIFTGKKINSWALSRVKIKQLSTVNQLLFKMINTNAFLPYIVENFNFKYKPVYLLRHPIAVALSQKKAFFQQGFVFHIQNNSYNKEIYHHNEFLQTLNTDYEHLIAAWCVRNMHALSYPTKKKWIQVFYEDLIINPEKEFDRLFKELGIVKPETVGVSARQPSQTDFKGDLKDSPSDQIRKWETIFSNHEKESFQRILGHFNISIYNAFNALPAASMP